MAFVLCSASGAGAESLQDALQSLVTNHPQIQAKTKAVNSAAEAIGAARSGYLPTVKLTGDSGPEYVDSPSRRTTEGRRYFKGRETSGVTVTQKIFDGFATSSAVEQALISQATANADLRAVRQTTLLEGTTAYIEVIKQHRLIALARDTERKVAEQLNLEDERVKKGSGIASDVLAAKQRLQVAKEGRVTYEGEFETASAKFRQVFGVAPNVAVLDDPPLPLDVLPKSLEEALDIAAQESPLIETARHGTELASEKRSGAEAGYYPTLDLIGKANYENDKNATIGVRRDWSLLLTANWELFSGFKTQSQVAQATWDYAASKDTQFHTIRKTDEAVRIAWSKLETTRRRLDLLENAATIAEEVWEAQKRKREAGKATVQEVLDEETRTNDARIKYTSAFYDMIKATYELLAAVGRLEVDTVMRGKMEILKPAFTYPSANAPAAAPLPPVADPAVPENPLPAPRDPVQRDGRAAPVKAPALASTARPQEPTDIGPPDPFAATVSR